MKTDNLRPLHSNFSIVPLLFLAATVLAALHYGLLGFNPFRSDSSGLFGHRISASAFQDEEARQYGPAILGNWSARLGDLFLVTLHLESESYAFEIRGSTGQLYYAENGTFTISRQQRPSPSEMNDFSIMLYANHEMARHLGHGMVTVFTPQKTVGPVDKSTEAALELEKIGSLGHNRQFATSLDVCRTCQVAEKHLSLVDQSQFNGMSYNFDPR